jgi:hypothetical protein
VRGSLDEVLELAIRERADADGEQVFAGAQDRLAVGLEGIVAGTLDDELGGRLDEPLGLAGDEAAEPPAKQRRVLRLVAHERGREATAPRFPVDDRLRQSPPDRPQPDQPDAKRTCTR